ncbi:Glycogen synthase [Frankliniella fusca]|uniref:Glycogen synthase n=1 Tax=Frankliniella fusca TaxID=407009 RepID=A0AAE1LQL2_9NEOP|nr:Glycogen synthase [Frankliniella fusca]
MFVKTCQGTLFGVRNEFNLGNNCGWFRRALQAKTTHIRLLGDLDGRRIVEELNMLKLLILFILPTHRKLLKVVQQCQTILSVLLKPLSELCFQANCAMWCPVMSPW